MRFNSRKNKHSNLVVYKNNIDSDVVFKIENKFSRTSVASAVKQEDLIFLIKQLSDLLVDDSKFINEEGLFVSNKRYKKLKKNIKHGFYIRRKFIGLTGGDEWVYMEVTDLNFETGLINANYSTAIEDIDKMNFADGFRSVDYLNNTNNDIGTVYELVKVTFITHNNKTKKTVKVVH